MRAIGYIRVSTEEQAQSGLGLEAQRAAIAAGALRLGLEVAEVFADEALSGSLPPPERPGLVAALAAVGRGEVLIVAKRDRLARDYLAVGLLERELRRKRARVVSAAGEGTESDDPSALLLRRMLDVFAEHERLMIAARTRAALRAKRARGERAGGVPFGYRAGAGGKLEELLEEQVALELIRSRRAAGFGYLRICQVLERRGYTPRGKRWYPETIRTLVNRPTA